MIIVIMNLQVMSIMRSSFPVQLLLALALLSVSSLAAAVVAMPSEHIDGELTTGSFLAQDSVGQFYYDAYELTVSADTTVTVTLSSPDFAPWLGLWESVVLPASSWESATTDLYTAAASIEAGNVGQTIGFNFLATTGTTYQLAVATSNYNPTPLGAYALSFETNGAPFTVTTVPLPAALWLFVPALGLVFTRRRTRS